MVTGFSPGSFDVKFVSSDLSTSSCSVGMLLSASFDEGLRGSSLGSVSSAGWVATCLSSPCSSGFSDGCWSLSGFVFFSLLSSAFLLSSVTTSSAFWYLRLLKRFSDFTSSGFWGASVCSSVDFSGFTDERLRMRFSDLPFSCFWASSIVRGFSPCSFDVDFASSDLSTSSCLEGTLLTASFDGRLCGDSLESASSSGWVALVLSSLLSSGLSDGCLSLSCLVFFSILSSSFLLSSVTSSSSFWDLRLLKRFSGFISSSFWGASVWSSVDSSDFTDERLRMRFLDSSFSCFWASPMVRDFSPGSFDVDFASSGLSTSSCSMGTLLPASFDKRLRRDSLESFSFSGWVASRLLLSCSSVFWHGCLSSSCFVSLSSFSSSFLLLSVTMSSDCRDLRLRKRFSVAMSSVFVGTSACSPVVSSGLRDERLRSGLSDSTLSGFSFSVVGSVGVSSAFKTKGFSTDSSDIELSFSGLSRRSFSSSIVRLSASFDERLRGDTWDSVSLSVVTPSSSFWDWGLSSFGFVSFSALLSSFLLSMTLSSDFWDWRLLDRFSGFPSSDFVVTSVCSSVDSSGFTDERLRTRFSDLPASCFLVSTSCSVVSLSGVVVIISLSSGSFVVDSSFSDL